MAPALLFSRKHCVSRPLESLSALPLAATYAIPNICQLYGSAVATPVGLSVSRDAAATTHSGPCCASLKVEEASCKSIFQGIKQNQFINTFFNASEKFCLMHEEPEKG